MVEGLPPPKKIPEKDWTKAEKDRGAKFPDYIVRMRARARTPEEQERYEALERVAKELQNKLFEAYPNPWTFTDTRERLDDILQGIEEQLIDIAAEARHFADQYRKFNVGGVVLGLRNVRYPENPWVILLHANTRPETVMGSIRKHCVELHLTDRMDPKRPETGLPEEKIDKAIALLLVAKPQMDDDSKVMQITLTPCQLCRDRLWDMTQENGDAIMSEDMPVITVNADNLGLRKIQQIRDIHKFHGELPKGHVEVE